MHCIPRLFNPSIHMFSTWSDDVVVRSGNRLNITSTVNHMVANSLHFSHLFITNIATNSYLSSLKPSVTTNDEMAFRAHRFVSSTLCQLISLSTHLFLNSSLPQLISSSTHLSSTHLFPNTFLRQLISSWTHLFLNSSLPQLISSSTHLFLNSSLPQLISSSKHLFLNTSLPQLIPSST